MVAFFTKAKKTHTHTHAPTHARARIGTHAHTHAHTDAHTHAHTHTISAASSLWLQGRLARSLKGFP